MESFPPPAARALQQGSHSHSPLVSNPRSRSYLIRRAAFGVVLACILAARHAVRPAGVVTGVSLLLFLVAAFVPVARLRWLQVRVAAAEHAVGAVVSAVVLGAVYFAFILPAGVALRHTGTLRFRGAAARDATSYWKRRSPGRKPTWERQF